MHCNLESNDEGTKTHVSHTVIKVLQLNLGSTQFNIRLFFIHVAPVIFPQLSLFLKMDDKLHRQLSCDIFPSKFVRERPSLIL